MFLQNKAPHFYLMMVKLSEVGKFTGMFAVVEKIFFNHFMKRTTLKISVKAECDLNYILKKIAFASVRICMTIGQIMCGQVVRCA